MRRKLLNLLPMLLCMLLAMGTRAYGADEYVKLYTPYTKISVPPGESINYNVDIINNSDETQSATLRIQGLPRSWKYELKAGGFTVSEIAVLPGEKKNFSLKVDVPFKVNKGTYRFTVSTDEGAELPLSVTVSEQGTYQTEFTTKQPNMQGNAKSPFNFNATLKNQTAEQQRDVFFPGFLEGLVDVGNHGGVLQAAARPHRCAYLAGLEPAHRPLPIGHHRGGV